MLDLKENYMEKKLQVYFYGQGAKEPKIIDVPEEGTVKELLDVLVSNGVAKEGSHVFLNDEEDHLLFELTLEKAGIKHKSHVHCHKCRRIKVEVSYNGKPFTEEVSPSAKAKRIIANAAKFFSIPEKDAAGLVLRLADNVELQDSDSIALFAVDCSISLFLVHPVRVEG